MLWQRSNIHNLFLSSHSLSRRQAVTLEMYLALPSQEASTGRIRADGTSKSLATWGKESVAESQPMLAALLGLGFARDAVARVPQRS